MNASTVKRSSFDRQLLRTGARSKRDWERAVTSGAQLTLSGQTTGLFPWSFNRAKTSNFRCEIHALTQLASAIASAFSCSAPSIPLRRGTVVKVLICSAIATGTAAATVGTLIVKGYLDHPGSFWQKRLLDRKQSPIFDSQGTLVGSVETQGKLSFIEAANFGYIPTTEPVPATFQKALLALENKHFLSASWRNTCGVDPLRTLIVPVLTGFKKGGSGISQQLAKQLLQSGPESKEGIVQKGYRWATQIGASCSMYEFLTKAPEGRDAVIHAYASYAPIWQGQGVLRGLTAASYTVFGQTPGELSHAQQILFAAAVKEPLRVAPPEATQIECQTVFPTEGNSQYDATAAQDKANRSRVNQCRVIHRALSMVASVLAGKYRDQALDELRSFQRDGIQPVNPFEAISDKKFVNLSVRLREALPSGILTEVRQEAEDSKQPGEPLVIAFDAVKQHEFAQAMGGALAGIQSSAKGRSLLCLPLVDVTSGYSLLRKCGVDKDKKIRADVLAIKADIATGGLKAMYASSPLILDSTQSIGSLAKWIILVAAVAEGYRADTLVCPRSASDGSRALLRVSAPVTGFASCDDGKHTISFEQATASSDNLAYYEVAKALGPVKLSAAAAALGFDDEHKSFNWAYELSFGTFGTMPRNLVTAAQALLSVAFDVKTTGAAPRVLVNVETDGNESIKPLMALLPTAAHRNELQKLLRAPVDADHGTLKYVRGDIDAGKTGSTQSAALDSTGRKYAHGKWSITYQQRTGEINLLMVASPLPSVPLAHHSIPGSMFHPALSVLLSANQE